MNVLTFDELRLKQDSIRKRIREGALFIYPTDTIYGLGCDATNAEAVGKLRALKGQRERPLSLIAPSREWISEHCQIDGNVDEWLSKLPGPYTFIMRLKNPKSLPEEVTLGSGTVGVRIPHHWVKDAVRLLGRPIITTSANKAGREPMYSIEDLDSELKEGVDFAVYEGERRGKGSQIVNLTKDNPEVLRK